MGCDIHMYTEFKRDGRWLPADAWQPDMRYGESPMRIPQHLRPPHDRDYDFFGWLANVRNGTWGEPLPVAAEPRGLPEDCCAIIRAESSEWGCDGHSHSWLTLAELKTAWGATKEHRIQFSGALNHLNASPELQAWLDSPEESRGKPPGGFGSSGSGPNGPLQQFVWYQVLGDELRESYNRLYDYLWNVRYEYGVKDEDVRCVFWFDN